MEDVNRSPPKYLDLTDAKIVGFRIVRPVQVPTAEELAKYWTSGVEKE
jgi:hypothetical protein